MLNTDTDLPKFFLHQFQGSFLDSFVTIVYSDTSRLKRDIIFESNVQSWLDCGTICLDKSVCVAFNIKEDSKENEINCQLTETTDHKFERGSTDDNGWTFYEGVGQRMVRIFSINLHFLVKY